METENIIGGFKSVEEREVAEAFGKFRELITKAQLDSNDLVALHNAAGILKLAPEDVQGYRQLIEQRCRLEHDSKNAKDYDLSSVERKAGERVARAQHNLRLAEAELRAAEKDHQKVPWFTPRQEAELALQKFDGEHRDDWRKNLSTDTIEGSIGDGRMNAMALRQGRSHG